MKLDVSLLPIFTDNYVFILKMPDKKAVVVDPGASEPVLSYCEREGLSLEEIWVTHHHWDHVDGIEVIKSKTNAVVRGGDKRIPCLDIMMESGKFTWNGVDVEVFPTPGHTLGHVVYYLKEQSKLFVGDTVFAMGCGRLFEGSAKQMAHSFEKIKTLPKDTWIYCTHEYTLTNSRLAIQLEPSNEDLKRRIQRDKGKRDQGLPTVPFLLEDEFETSPFFRTNCNEIKSSLGLLTHANETEVFAEIRKKRDAL